MGEPAKLGQQTEASPTTQTSDFNAITFLVRQILSKNNHCALVQVISCTNSGGVAGFGFVDVQPLVNLLDGFGQVIKDGQGVIYGLPYARMQGGANAVILDPEINDIGIAIFADEDISNVKTELAQANPASSRRFSMADGIYIGGILNGAPTQYVQFNASGITVKSAGTVTISAPSVKLENAGSALQTLLNSTLLTWLNSHTHTSAAAGSPTSSPITTPPSTVSTTTVQAE